MNPLAADVDLHGPCFLAARRDWQPSAVCLLGVPYDGTTSFRPGARFGPAALRQASIGLETYSPEQDADYEAGAVPLVDLGDLDIPFGSADPVMDRVRAAQRALLRAGATPLILGGEHSITAASVEAMVEKYPELVVVQIDAHADLRDGYLGERYSHAAAMRRCLDVLAPGSLVQVGIRSGTREEFQEMRGADQLLAPAPHQLADRLRAYAGRPIYLTVDLDAFDPAYFPGTGTPEPGGIDWPTFASLLAAIPAQTLVGADVMELAPMLDPSGVSAVLAAKVTREIILRLQAGVEQRVDADGFAFNAEDTDVAVVNTARDEVPSAKIIALRAAAASETGSSPGDTGIAAQPAEPVAPDRELSAEDRFALAHYGASTEPPAFDRGPAPSAPNVDGAVLCRLEEVPMIQPLRVEHMGQGLLVCRNGADAFVVHERCPHKGHSMAHGVVMHGELVCPWHQYRFDLDTGRCNRPRCAPATTIPARVQDGFVILV